MLRAIFTFSLGTMFGVFLTRRAQNLLPYEGLRKFSPKNDVNKKVLVRHSKVEQQSRE